MAPYSITKEKRTDARKMRLSPLWIYAQLKPDLESGSERTRLPVAEKIALAIAGRIGGSAGSPNPVGLLFDFNQCTSISGGACVRRTSLCWWKLVCTTRP